ncbi:MAG: cysteine desulfurase [Oscillatoriales cyanobacterium SM2_2_1]|nr:cysteine desulfurase [Oscillatoriales cyanobacterium SM2_2_1]
MHRPIYLDLHATSPTDPRVVAAMMPYFGEAFGNPSSQGHGFGWEAAAAVAQAREVLAAAIGTEVEELIFTSGATEANNLAIKGVAEAYPLRRHIVTVQTEHSAVLGPCRYLESLGWAVTYLPVQEHGLLDLAVLRAAIRPDTLLVSVMAANNEIGVLQPLVEIGAIARARGVLFHTDAAQAIGKIPLDVERMKIDLMSLTAHKVYGPKGIGALYIRRRSPRVNLAPQLHGGGQERGLRSGTLPTPLIVGFGEAIALALAERTTELERIRRLRDRLWQHLAAIPGIQRHGHREQVLPHTLNVSFPPAIATQVQSCLRGRVAYSHASACSSGRPQPSHVLRALGVPEERAIAAFRFGIGRGTTTAEIDTVAELIQGVVVTHA